MKIIYQIGSCNDSHMALEKFKVLKGDFPDDDHITRDSFLYRNFDDAKKAEEKRLNDLIDLSEFKIEQSKISLEMLKTIKPSQVPQTKNPYD
jgi:hypothetical protein